METTLGYSLDYFLGMRGRVMLIFSSICLYVDERIKEQLSCMSEYFWIIDTGFCLSTIIQPTLIYRRNATQYIYLYAFSVTVCTYADSDVEVEIMLVYMALGFNFAYILWLVTWWLWHYISSCYNTNYISSAEFK